MELRTAAALLASCIKNVCVEAASARIDDAQEKNRAKDDPAQEGGMSALSSGSVGGRICMHESGHAVFAQALGMQIEHVRVRSDGTGATTYQLTDERDVLSMAVVSVAGVAVELILGADEQRQFTLASSADVLSARLEIDQAGELLNAEAVARVAVCAASTNWQSINRIAAALRALGELDGPTVSALCGVPQ